MAPPGPIRGRGAASNSASRFLQRQTIADVPEAWADPAAGAPETRVLPDRTVRLITRNRSPDIPFNQSINPYKGCEHGCIYCFARPTHAYLDLSPGLDFESRLFYKTQPRAHLLRELGRAGYRCEPLAIGTNTDPYQPLERRARVTREILETLLELRHPVSIVTKSQGVLRDLDLLQALAGQGLVHVFVSMTTLSNGLKTRLEPRTASPAARLRVITALHSAGVPTGAMIAPVIPWINDMELEDLVHASAAAGAGALNYILLRLPREVGPLFEEWLAVHYPDRAARVMAQVRDSRGGKVYDAAWGQRLRGTGVYAELLARRFALACRKAGVAAGSLPPLRTEGFTPPRSRAQFELF